MLVQKYHKYKTKYVNLKNQLQMDNIMKKALKEIELDAKKNVRVCRY